MIGLTIHNRSLSDEDNNLSLVHFFYNRTVYKLKSQAWEGSPLLPVIATLILAITVFLLILFRQSPGLVAGTVAGCLIVVSIYLFLNTISDNLKYE